MPLNGAKKPPFRAKMTIQPKILFISAGYCCSVFSQSSFLDDNDMDQNTKAGKFRRLEG
jgi:hypothetical protein